MNELEHTKWAPDCDEIILRKSANVISTITKIYNLVPIGNYCDRDGFCCDQNPPIWTLILYS